MAKKHYSAEDFQKIPLQNVVIQTASADPSSPATGQIYLNTSTGYKYYNGSAWETFALKTKIDAATDVTSGLLPLARGGMGYDNTASGVGQLMFKASAVAINGLPNGNSGYVLQSNGAGVAPSWVPFSPNASGSAGGDLQGTYPNPTLGPGVVTSAKILDGTITLADLSTALYSGAANTDYALRQIGYGAFSGMPGSASLSAIATQNPTNADISMSGYRLLNVGTPSGGTDAANKAYVDGIAQGLIAKQSVRAATVSGVDLGLSGGLPSGNMTIDGVTIANGDRFLAKNQSDSTQNGIYVKGGTSATRTGDADTAAELRSAFTFVEEGTVNANSGWLQTSDNITVGTTGLVWVQFSGAGSYTGQGAITVSAGIISVVTDNGTIEQPSGLLRVKDLGITTSKIADSNVTTAKIANSAVDLTTKVTNVLPITNGGTGATTAAGARNQLQLTGNVGQSVDIPALTAGTWTTVRTYSGSNFQSNLGNIVVVDATTKEVVDIETSFVNNPVGTVNVAVRSDVAVAANALQMSIMA